MDEDSEVIMSSSSWQIIFE